MYLKHELYELIRSDESIFDFIQNSSLDGLWYWDLENPENEWMNARFWTVLGYNPDEMPHKSSAWQNIINQDDLNVENDNFTRHCENPDHPYDQIVRYRHKDGSTKWIRCRGLAIRDSAGKPVRMLGAHQDITELKSREEELCKANEKVQESEEKYRAFYQNAPLSYQSLDENGCFIDINPMWLKTLGYERSEVIGKWYGDFLHPDYVEHFRVNFPAFKKRGYVSDVQFKLRRKDNSFIYVSFEGCIGYTPEGKFKQTYCVFKDITEQKALENALIKAKEAAEENESQFRSLFNSASDAIFIADAESGIIVNANSTAADLLNMLVDDIIGKHQRELHPPEMNHYSESSFQKQMAEIDEEKVANPVENYVLRSDGAHIPVEVTGSRVLYKGRDCIMGIFRDITKRKHIEEKLIKSEERYALVIKASEQGIWDWNVETNEVFYSEQWKKQIGYKDDELKNEFNTWVEHLHPNEKEYCLNTVLSYLNNPVEHFYLDFRFRHKDGTYRWIHNKAASLKNDEGKVIRLFGTHNDISRNKEAELEIRNLNETLEKRIAERTRQLEASNKELSFHLSELEQFSYISNHDLQEPLRTLVQFSQLLHENYSGSLDEDGNLYIDFISKSALRMKEMVRDLLEYSLLGKESRISTIDCNIMLKEVLFDIDISVKKCNARIVVEELPNVNGYETELRLLFQNLIANAIKYQKTGNIPEIHISAESHNNEWLFKVSDNGIGFDEKYRDKIFILFQRLHKRNEYEGTGIGLAHCKKIVELHGGRIWGESTPDQGSTFLFTIPKT